MITIKSKQQIDSIKLNLLVDNTIRKWIKKYEMHNIDNY